MFGRKKPAAMASVPPATTDAPPKFEALLDGIRYVGMVSPPGTFVEALNSPMPCAGASGTPGWRFAIETQDGPGFAFFFPRFASVWLGSEPKPRPEIPNDMIENRVPTYGDAVKQLFQR